MSGEWDFDKHAYIALADEFDTMGLDTVYVMELDDFEPDWVAGARRYATRWGLPLPWVIGSLDIALEHVARAERLEREEGVYVITAV
jgi:hypothetical protein